MIPDRFTLLVAEIEWFYIALDVEAYVSLQPVRFS